MIITDKFVYIHMPKTGGTFVESALRQLFSSTGTHFVDTALEAHRAGTGSVDQHEPFAALTQNDRAKDVVHTARNPYDHHVSYFEFGWWKNHPEDTFDEKLIRERFPHYPDLTFAEYLEGIYTWGLLSQTWIKPEFGEVLEKADMGPLTYDYVRFIFEDPEKILADLQYYVCEGGYRRELPKVHFLRTNNLNHDLHDFLLKMGYKQDQVEFILGMGKVLPSGSSRDARNVWQNYYTDELKDLVRYKERFIFRLFPDFDV